MDDKIVAIYTIVSDFLMAIHYYEDPQRQMSDAEVMATAISPILRVTIQNQKGESNA
ncbi:MAG: hypothetical protein H6657_04470 [Ardenticatenaceae bacterium]|nr:hypothetical protein [Ardenticatenaceae bacterium]